MIAKLRGEVVRVAAGSDAVSAHIPWRRRDSHPEKKSISVVDARMGNDVSNVSLLEINREFGDIAFQPTS